jgi:hypothetical protein
MSDQRTTDTASPFDPFSAKDEKKQEGGRGAATDTMTTTTAAAKEQPSVASGRTSSVQSAAPDLSIQPSDSSSLDPFGIGDLTDQKAGPILPTRTTSGASALPRSSTGTSQPSRASAAAVALPPKMLTKMTIYEEVTSVASVLDPGTARISVEGSVYMQIHSSDARRNAPFQLLPSDDASVSLKPNSKYTRPSSDPQSPGMIVTIPKQELGYVPVLYYTMDQTMDHMPVLLERKITIHEDSCRIAFQVRTKLTNQGDLNDFTLAVAIPEKVDAESIEILRGDGAYDGLKRLIKYKLSSLARGESFMVSAQAKLWKSLEEDEEIHFPVVLRCTSSEDRISAVDFAVTEAPEQPSSLTVHKAHSFRLLHRLS